MSKNIQKTVPKAVRLASDDKTVEAQKQWNPSVKAFVDNVVDEQINTLKKTISKPSQYWHVGGRLSGWNVFEEKKFKNNPKYDNDFMDHEIKGYVARKLNQESFKDSNGNNVPISVKIGRTSVFVNSKSSIYVVVETSVSPEKPLLERSKKSLSDIAKEAASLASSMIVTRNTERIVTEWVVDDAKDWVKKAQESGKAGSNRGGNSIDRADSIDDSELNEAVQEAEQAALDVFEADGIDADIEVTWERVGKAVDFSWTCKWDAWSDPMSERSTREEDDDDSLALETLKGDYEQVWAESVKLDKEMSKLRDQIKKNQAKAQEISKAYTSAGGKLRDLIAIGDKYAHMMQND